MIVPASTPNMMFKVQVKDSDWCLGLAVHGLISCSFIVEGEQREKSISKYTDAISCSPEACLRGSGEQREKSISKYRDVISCSPERVGERLEG